MTIKKGKDFEKAVENCERKKNTGLRIFSEGGVCAKY